MVKVNRVSNVRNLLSWYNQNKRSLPWRTSPINPYYVWLSEIMLQQTTVDSVKPYFQRFIQKWPTIQDLAQASKDDILHLWQGLGYYTRAHNLQRCAQQIIEQYNSIFPHDVSELQKLPGIGPYTAAAIAAIVYDKPEAAVDGNVIRVISRLYAIQQTYPESKAKIATYMQALVPKIRPGDFAQAFMDLGSLVCTVRRPKCDECPINANCRAYAANAGEQYPRRHKKGIKPTRYGVAYLMRNAQNQFLIQKRDDKGLLAGLMEIPSTPWREKKWSTKEAITCAPLQASRWQPVDGEIHHTFTHFHLKLQVVQGRIENPSKLHTWCSSDDVHKYPFSTLMKKLIAHSQP